MTETKFGIRETDKKSFLILAAAAVILGLALIIWVEKATEILCYVIGGLMLLYGLVDIFRYFFGESVSAFRSGLVDGALAFGIGLFFVLRPQAVSTAFGIVIGIVILVDSLFKLQFGFNLLHARDKSGWIIAALAAAGIIMAAITISMPDMAAVWLGILLLADGIMDLVTAAVISRFEKDFKKKLKSIVSE